MIYSRPILPTLRHQGFSFYCLKKSEEGADTDPVSDFGLPNGRIVQKSSIIHNMSDQN